jgi:tRNA dimethylallyltransferase
MIRGWQNVSRTYLRQKSKMMIITGPTASGKTQIAFRVCKKLNGEIVNADSVQFYRELKVGSNKETHLKIKTHLIDLISVQDRPIGSGNYVPHANSTIDSIVARGSVPVMTGGSGFFLQCFTNGGVPTEQSELNRKTEIRKFLQENESWEESIGRLRVNYPDLADRIYKNDYFRLSRVFEMIETSNEQPLPKFEIESVFESMITDPFII